MVGDNTVASQLLAASTSTFWIYATVTKDVEGTAALDCPGKVVGMLLLFAKKALIVVNFDISHHFTCSHLAIAILNSLHDIHGAG